MALKGRDGREADIHSSRPTAGLGHYRPLAAAFALFKDDGDVQHFVRGTDGVWDRRTGFCDESRSLQKMLHRPRCCVRRPVSRKWPRRDKPAAVGEHEARNRRKSGGEIKPGAGDPLPTEGGPDRDFEVDPKVLEIGKEWRLAVERHLGKSGVQKAAFEDQLPWLVHALAEFTAQERFRKAVPNAMQVKKLVSVKHRATMLRKVLAGFTSEETDWLLARSLPTKERDAFLHRLEQLELGPSWTIEYPPAAAKLDEALRRIWERLTQQRPTVNNAADDMESGVAPSPFHEFVRLASLGIPADVRPGEGARTLSARPKALEKQRAAEAEKSRERADLVRSLHRKLSPK